MLGKSEMISYVVLLSYTNSNFPMLVQSSKPEHKIGKPLLNCFKESCCYLSMNSHLELILRVPFYFRNFAHYFSCFSVVVCLHIFQHIYVVFRKIIFHCPFQYKLVILW